MDLETQLLLALARAMPMHPAIDALANQIEAKYAADAASDADNKGEYPTADGTTAA